MGLIDEAQKAVEATKKAASDIKKKVSEIDPVGYAKDKAVTVGRAIGTEPVVSAARIKDIADEFQLVETPAVMQHHMSAPQGAELMRQWFGSPAFVLPESWRLGNINFLSLPSQNLNTTAIKMSWVLSFGRAGAAMDTMEKTLVATPKAAVELRRVLQRQQFLTGAREFIGTSRDAVVLHETAHLNFTTVPWGMSVDPLDCALASFTAHMAVSGFVQPINTKSTSKTHDVEITELHFYVRDCYDFTSDREPLGSWNRRGAVVTPGVPGTFFAENNVVRKWRARHGRGGDFIVFSDLRSKKLNRLVTIQI